MKNLFVFVLIMFSFILTTFSQTFNGIQIGESLTKTQNDLKNKGFVFVEQNGVMYHYIGKIDNKNITIFIVSTPKSNIVWKLQAFVDEAYTWVGAKISFDKYCTMLNRDYGNFNDNYRFFCDPYYEWDGHEMQALRVEKCFWYTDWLDSNGNTIALELLSYNNTTALTAITYENKIGAELKIKEQE